MPPKKTTQISKAERRRRKKQSEMDRAKAIGSDNVNRTKKAVKQTYNRDVVQVRRQQHYESTGGRGMVQRMAAADMLAYPYNFQVRLPLETTPIRSSLQRWRTIDSTISATALSVLPGGFPNGSVLVALIGLPGLMYAKCEVLTVGTRVMYAATFSGNTANTTVGGQNQDSIGEVLGPVEVVTNGTTGPSTTTGQPNLELLDKPRPLELYGMQLFGSATYQLNTMVPWHGKMMPLFDAKSVGRFIFMHAEDQLYLRLDFSWSYMLGVTLNMNWGIGCDFEMERLDEDGQIKKVGPARTLLLDSLAGGSTGTGSTRTVKSGVKYLSLKTKVPVVYDADAVTSTPAGLFRPILSRFWIAPLESASTDTPDKVVADLGAAKFQINTFKVGMKMFLNANFPDQDYDGMYNTSQVTLSTAGNTYDGNTAWVYDPAGTAGMMHWRLLSGGAIDPDKGGDFLIGERCRCLAASLLISNVSPEMAKGGTIFAGRVLSGSSSTSTNPDNLQFYNLDWSSFQSMQIQRMDAAKGAFTFLLMDPARNGYARTTERDMGFYVDYDSFSQAAFHFAVIPPTTSLTTAGATTNAYDITVDSCVEFITNSLRYPKDVSRIQMQELFNANAALAIGSNEFWYENPLHLAQVFGFLKNAMRKSIEFVADRSSQIEAAAEMVAPMATPYVKGVTFLAKRFARR